MRKLPEYYRFNIDTTQGFVRFTDTDGVTLPDYRSKLTKSQWAKASEYLTRNLVPFSGYEYTIKPEYTDKKVITIK